jgi:hypothetical protein
MVEERTYFTTVGVDDGTKVLCFLPFTLSIFCSVVNVRETEAA